MKIDAYRQSLVILIFTGSVCKYAKSKQNGFCLNLGHLLVVTDKVRKIGTLLYTLYSVHQHLSECF